MVVDVGPMAGEGSSNRVVGDVLQGEAVVNAELIEGGEWSRSGVGLLDGYIDLGRCRLQENVRAQASVGRHADHEPPGRAEDTVPLRHDRFGSR